MKKLSFLFDLLFFNPGIIFVLILVILMCIINVFGTRTYMEDPRPRPTPEPTAIQTTGPEIIAKITKTITIKPNGTDIFSLMNYEREKLHIRPLIYNKTLEKTAYAKACSILNSGFWSHSLPDGRTYDRFMRDNGATMFRDLGENLSRNLNVNEAMVSWMASPGHRQNILDGRWRYAGIGNCGNVIAVHFAR